MFDLTNKTAFITGGAGLLGRKHSEAIIEFGGSVVVADINLGLAKKACQELGASAIPMQVDVNCRESIQKAVDSCDKIDILINNAAKDPKVGTLSNETMFETMTEEFWKEGIETILNGTFLCSQIVINKMLSQGGGVVLNIASDLGVISPDQRIYDKGSPKPITYSAAKWGVIGMTKYLSTYFLGKNIRVNSLSPAGNYENCQKGLGLREVDCEQRGVLRETFVFQSREKVFLALPHIKRRSFLRAVRKTIN